MHKILLRSVFGGVIFFLSSLGWAISGITSDTFIEPQKVMTGSMIIQCSKVNSLVFCGVPNETQNGEITFKLLTKPSRQPYLVVVTGTAFENGDALLETQYQPENTDLWYKAGVAFSMLVKSGNTNTIRYKAISGSQISSQQAGTYTAKLSFIANTCK